MINYNTYGKILEFQNDLSRYPQKHRAPLSLFLSYFTFRWCNPILQMSFKNCATVAKPLYLVWNKGMTCSN
jgi:hypothetical protein